jgi:serine/threonine protein kinase
MSEIIQTGSLLQTRYKLETCLQQRLGQATWRATDQQTGQAVIVKVLNLGSMPDWDALKLFEREVQVLQTLDHPQIPKLLAQFQDSEKQNYFLVMQAIEGLNLREYLLQKGVLAENQAQSLARQTLEILSYLHQFSPPVIHRDIKPSNLVLNQQDRVYLIDFGAVKDLSSTQHTVVGTFGYLSPEQLGGQVVAASDLYALGITLVEALSGTAAEALPRDGLRIKLRQSINVSIGFLEWLEELLAPELSLRFASAEQALQALDNLKPRLKLETLQLPPKCRVTIAETNKQAIEIKIQPSKSLGAYLKILLLPPLWAFITSLSMIAPMGIGLLILDEMYDYRPPLLVAWDLLLRGKFMPELWLTLIPIFSFVLLWSFFHFYRLWFRPVTLRLTDQEFICETHKQEKWRLELNQLNKIRIGSHTLILSLESKWFSSSKRIWMRLSGAEQKLLKTVLREYLRQYLQRRQFQKVLPGLKT